MSNYPPGAENDPRAPYNQRDHSHQHDWRPVRDTRIFEDGAAIFHEECEYAEGRYGEGWQCEETRYIRCGVERVVVLRDDAPDIAYLASEDKPTERFGVIERIYEDALCAVEIEGDDLEYEQFDPPNDQGDGYIRIRVGDKYQVIYKQ